jgi:hypothetical protein
VLSEPHCHDSPQIVSSLSSVSSSDTLLPRKATSVLIFPLARSSSLATSFLMRLTFRLRLPSPDRILLIFCYRIFSPRLPCLPQTFGTRGPRLHLPRLHPTMPATPSGWTLPFCGTVSPTGCPRRPGRLRLPLRLRHLLRQQVPAPRLPPWLPLLLPGSGMASITAVVRSRRYLRPQRRRRRYPRLQSLLHGRLVPGRVRCRHLCSGMASLRRPPA